MEQKQTLNQEKPRRRKSSDLITKHIGKHIVLELESIGTDVYSGKLSSYDKTFLEIKDLNHHGVNIDSTIAYSAHEESKKINNHNDINNKESIEYSLTRKIRHKDIVASIQLYDDVINARKQLI